MKIDVILLETVRTTDQPYTYNLPETLAESVRPGSRVLVPFGKANRLREAIVLSVSSGMEPSYKSVHHVFDEGYELSPDMVALSCRIRDYYLSSHSRVIRTMIPGGSTRNVETRLEFAAPEDEQAYRDEPIALDRLISEGRVKLKASYRLKGAIKTEKWICRTASVQELKDYLETVSSSAVRQRTILENLIAGDACMSITQADASPVAARRLAELGLIHIEERRVYRDARERSAANDEMEAHRLNHDQQAAYDAVTGQEGYGMFLLHGVTGSGKTEVYLHLVRSALDRGLQAIVLVPEISLVPQLADRFIARFGARVAFYHSRMSASERLDEWIRIKRGEFDIVIGARSAVFAPFDRLGLILIDEEHVTSYKSDSEPRYDARHVAAMRAQQAGIPLVLGSATPSMETFRMTIEGQAVRLPLDHRVNRRTMPATHLVDMRAELSDGNRSIFSRILREKLQDRLDKKEQTILFLNKKGYASFISCRQCGHVMRCPHCDLPLMYHKQGHYGECRICSYKQSLPKTCPECGSGYFKQFGIGTEKVEEMIGRVFPQARVLRMDSDTMSRRDALLQAYDTIKQGHCDIILGTQMVAKGHDFPKVTLVGILAADINLNIPTFNASENTYQLLTQAIGRSGRGNLPGEVVIQTYAPDHYAVQAACRHDYGQFVSDEAKVRSALSYPPYRSLVNLIVLSKERSRAQDTATALAGALREKTRGMRCELIGPGPAVLEKARRLYRYQIVMKFMEVDQERIKGIMKEIIENSTDPDIYLNVDVDPISLI